MLKVIVNRAIAFVREIVREIVGKIVRETHPINPQLNRQIRKTEFKNVSATFLSADVIRLYKRRQTKP